MTTPVAPLSPEHAQFAHVLMQKIIYLMGFSFVVGSLSTIFILLIMDMVRKSREEAMRAEQYEDDDINDFKDQA